MCGVKKAADSGTKHFKSISMSLLANHRQHMAKVPTAFGIKHRSTPSGLLKGGDLSQEIIRGLDQFLHHLREEI